jgi:bifunctional non-homologous end joining protein LigD
MRESVPAIAGVRVSHPSRIVYPDLGLTKLDVVRYYEAVAEHMVPHLHGRPLTLKQCAPDADRCRYLRHSHKAAPAEVRVVPIQEKTKIGDYMMVDDLSGLIALAQRNMLEFHTWNATIDHLEQPDRLVFDLDPGPRVTWREVVEAARVMRDTLRRARLESWVKTTGGRGVHIVVPIRRAQWADCLAFARTIASELAEREPARYTTRFAKAGRERQILVDYLRNNRTNTSVAAYSARARPGATVSMPLAWEELTPRMKPERWTIRTVPQRLAREGDAWSGYTRVHQRL